MSCIVQVNQKYFIYSKGAPDLLLGSCARYVDKNGEIKPIDQDYRDMLQHHLSQFAAESLRTLLICYR